MENETVWLVYRTVEGALYSLVLMAIFTEENKVYAQELRKEVKGFLKGTFFRGTYELDAYPLVLELD